VKVNLARFSWALALIAAMALTVGAGMRWDSFRILFWL
jgi:hypothetical protein